MRLVQFTRQDVVAMVGLGIIPEDASTELLNGVIVIKDRAARGEDPFMVGKDHYKCVERFSNLRNKINSAGRFVQSQQPLVCSDIHVPEPDFAVIRGRLEDLQDLPNSSDTFCVVEVADSSYERDAGAKLVSYARAGIQQYIIINLRNRTAEVYTQPDIAAGSYPPPVIISESGKLLLRVGESDVFEVALSELLP